MLPFLSRRHWRDTAGESLSCYFMLQQVAVGMGHLSGVRVQISARALGPESLATLQPTPDANASMSFLKGELVSQRLPACTGVQGLPPVLAPRFPLQPGGVHAFCMPTPHADHLFFASILEGCLLLTCEIADSLQAGKSVTFSSLLWAEIYLLNEV